MVDWLRKLRKTPKTFEERGIESSQPPRGCSLWFTENDISARVKEIRRNVKPDVEGGCPGVGGRAKMLRVVSLNFETVLSRVK